MSASLQIVFDRVNLTMQLGEKRLAIDSLPSIDLLETFCDGDWQSFTRLQQSQAFGNRRLFRFVATGCNKILYKVAYVAGEIYVHNDVSEMGFNQSTSVQ